jgi:hypothetical protein
MRRRWLALGALVLLVAAAVLLQPREAAPVPPPPRPPTASATATVVADRSIPLAALADPTVTPEKKVRRVHEVVQAYVMAMKGRSRVPLSSNAEFTQALTGKNILKVVFLPSDHPSISASGELLDPWETPYFFHALAADSWEVASAGPDRVPFNEDDLVFPPNRNPNSLQPIERGGDNP